MNNNFQDGHLVVGIVKGVTPRAWIGLCISIVFAIPILLAAAAAEGAPIVREGKSCPSNYRRSGDYCVPKSNNDNSTAAVVKKGICPAGYRVNGDYCVAKSSRDDSRHAVEKKGACPAGYKTSGKYCVERYN